MLVLPVSQVPPFDAEQEYPADINGRPQETYLDWMRSAYLVTVTGCPAISVPAGFTEQGEPANYLIVGTDSLLAFPRDTTITGTIVIIGVPRVTVASTVQGSVVVIGGDLWLHPGVAIAEHADRVNGVAADQRRVVPPRRGVLGGLFYGDVGHGGNLPAPVGRVNLACRA